MKRWRWGVEPTMFLYMLAYMLTSVVEEDLIVFKACTATHHYSRDICANISKLEYQLEKQIVQVTVSWFHMWENVASHAIPAVLALFLGSWSDRVGRKLPLLLGLTGGLVYSLALLLNSFMENWRVEWILLTGALPCGLTGGPLAVFMAAFSYLADTTSTEDRTFRTTLLEVSYLITMPTGVYLGSYLFNNVFERSHGAMFSLNCACLILSIIYSCNVLEWNTASKKQRRDQSSDYQTKYDTKDVNNENAGIESGCEDSEFIQQKQNDNPSNFNHNKVTTISGQCYDHNEDSTTKEIPKPQSANIHFSQRWTRWMYSFVLYISRHVSESIKTFVRPRKEGRRKLLYLCLIGLGLYTFQREEKHSIYLYTQLTFNWDLATFSMFRTFQSVLYIVGLLIGVPVLNKLLQVRDTVTMMIGAASHVAARITFSLAKSKEAMYTGSALGLLGPIVAPVIRSTVSKLVPSYERGKVFALLSVSDMAVPLISGAFYSLIYSHTLTTFPQAVFLLTMASQIIVFTIAVMMECILKGKTIEQAVEDPVLTTRHEETNSIVV